MDIKTSAHLQPIQFSKIFKLAPFGRKYCNSPQRLFIKHATHLCSEGLSFFLSFMARCG